MRSSNVLCFCINYVMGYIYDAEPGVLAHVSKCAQSWKHMIKKWLGRNRLEQDLYNGFFLFHS